MDNRLWNNFITKSYDQDLYIFSDLTMVEQQGALLAELYQESASGDGWEYFFDHLSEQEIDFDHAEDLVNPLLNDILKKNFSKAKKYYNKNGFEGDYEELNKPLIESESYLEESINQFIANNIDLYK